MELIGVYTQQAYEQIRERIITLTLAPGAVINPQALAGELGMGLTAVEEALKLLVHDDLVVVTPRHGLYMADITLADLEQISETRLALEPLCARLAAQRATADDLAVLDALCAAQKEIDAEGLFDLDHKFHQAIAQRPPTTNTWLAPSTISSACRSGCGTWPCPIWIFCRRP
jgi:DNA-binding GntR family transcriptional regulator